MQKEYDALCRRGTWELEPRRNIPPGSKIIRSVWSFKVKTKDGKWSADKSRGCADGRYQTQGVDYTDNYAPATKLSTVRMTQALVAENDFTSRQLDIDNAFLYGRIEDGITLYMWPLPGFEEYDIYWDDERNAWACDLLVPHLVMGLYGLVQSALLFNIELVKFFVDYGFTQCLKEPCVFVKKDASMHLIVPTLVDDLLPANQLLHSTGSRSTSPRYSM